MRWFKKKKKNLGIKLTWIYDLGCTDNTYLITVTVLAYLAQPILKKDEK